MSTPTTVVVKQYDYWMRVNLSLENHIKQCLLNILHNDDNDHTYVGLPRDEGLLYQEMIAFQQCVNQPPQRKLKALLKSDHWALLCPHGGRTKSETFDITLLVLLIRYKTNCPPPSDGWDQKLPDIHDTSKAAFVLLARQLRNEIKHGSKNDISTKFEFENIWKRIEHVLTGLNYANIKLFHELKTASLDPKMQQTVQIMKLEYEDLEERYKDDFTELQENVEDGLASFEDELKDVKNEQKYLQKTYEWCEDVCEDITDDVNVLEENVRDLKSEIKDYKDIQEDRHEELEKQVDVISKDLENEIKDYKDIQEDRYEEFEKQVDVISKDLKNEIKDYKDIQEDRYEEFEKQVDVIKKDVIYYHDLILNDF